MSDYILLEKYIVSQGQVIVEKTPTEDNHANMLNMILSTAKFNQYCLNLGRVTIS